MRDQEPSVEGPDWAERVREAEVTVQRLESQSWDFNSAPEAFAKEADADVFGKEMVIIFDGHTITRIGRLALAGVGDLFNLMGPIHPLAIFRTAAPDVIDSLNQQLGSKGLADFAEFERYGMPQSAQFYNFTMFFQLRDLVFWSRLYQSGVSPSTLEHMKRNFAAGMIIQNALYRPSRASSDRNKPAVMMLTDLSVTFPSTVMEWMDRPLYGGLLKETLHIETLLTTRPTKVSHPYLPLVEEGRVEYAHKQYYLRRFAGVSPKGALRGPGIAPEKQTSFGADRGWINERELAGTA